jgi:hypothetical protein
MFAEVECSGLFVALGPFFAVGRSTRVLTDRAYLA